MHDHWLIAFSLVISTLGVSMLLWLSTVVEPPAVTSLDEEQLGAPLRVEGKIVAARNLGSVTSFTIITQHSVNAVVFADVNLTPGSCVILEGTRDAHEGQPQLLVEKIERCD